MRPIEVLILLAIHFSILTHLIPRGRRPRSLSRLPALAAILVIIHLVFEGYRWQMVPAYSLAAFLVLGMALWSRGTATQRTLAARILINTMAPVVFTSRPTGTAQEMMEETMDIFFKGIEVCEKRVSP